ARLNALTSGGRPSRIEFARCAAFLRGFRSAKRTEDAVEGGIAHAKPVLLTDEVMAQMVLLDPATETRSRLVRNVGDIMHPFIVQDGEHHSEQRGSRGVRPEHQRE